MFASFVALPDDAKILILRLITSLLTALFAFLFNKWGLDLRGLSLSWLRSLQRSLSPCSRPC